MASVRDSLLDLEKHRRLLEDNIHQLQKALQHWRTWDAEYEALKEEVQEVSAATEPRDLRRVQENFEGELVDRKEINDIFGIGAPKTKGQIVNVLERRIDYVTKNIDSLGKQLEEAETKYAAATVLSQPDATDDEGQPITEIVEQLDDEDNVISYHLNKPGESLPHVREALEKAGVEDLPPVDAEGAAVDAASQAPSEPSSSRSIRPSAPSRGTKPASQPTPSPKKAVSFSEDTKPEQDEPLPPISRNAQRVEQIMKNAKDQEQLADQAPIVPDNEDPEDAAMRQEMLKYGMGEVGAVVAELQLEEGVSDENDDSGVEYSDLDMDDDDDEDQYGRFKGPMVTEDYRQRMLELEQRLGIKSRFTPDPDVDGSGSDSGSEDERIGRIVVSTSQQAAESSASNPEPTKSSIKEASPAATSGKKGVRFATSLDIAQEDESASAPVVEKKGVVEPLSGIVERSAPTNPVETKPARKTSRFKKNRGETGSQGGIPKGPLDAPTEFLDHTAQHVSTGPEGTTLADTLVERDAPSGPPQADDFEEASSRHEVADEYQRMRRKFIQRQGGFMKEDENPTQPLDEDEGGPERMSRFRAARLSRQ